ncbi:MAG: MBL fold metallo-hydrolase, partial [Vicinamibacterales bacterium]|nr:MBL fold metallo-hydrolase [Vicinamibacterales bacterium]
MRREVVLGALVLIGALSVVGVASQRGGQMNVEVEQLEDNLFVLRGGGGNSAAFVTGNGVVLVDTKLAGWGQPLIDKIGELTSNPITTIINTHAHFDHVDGNVEFPASVEFVAHENTQRLMRENNAVRGLGR